MPVLAQTEVRSPVALVIWPRA